MQGGNPAKPAGGAAAWAGAQRRGSSSLRSPSHAARASRARRPPPPAPALDPRSRNKQLIAAYVLMVLDALIAVIFVASLPSDPRLDADYVSRKQTRTIYLQGFVALIDAVLSCYVVVHVLRSILHGSLDGFLEAAATKICQAIIFTLLQTGYPTTARIAVVSLLLLLRASAAVIIFRVALLSGLLTTRPSKEVPRIVQLVLEAGQPLAGRDTPESDYARQRPLTMSLVEGMLLWVVPLQERTTVVGLGRRQVLMIGFFLTLLIAYAAFSEYWAITGDQDELFDEGALDEIIANSFDYLRAGTSADRIETVSEAEPYLPANATAGDSRVVVVVLSGLQYAALTAAGSPLREWRRSVEDHSVLCKLQAP